MEFPLTRLLLPILFLLFCDHLRVESRGFNVKTNYEADDQETFSHSVHRSKTKLSNPRSPLTPPIKRPDSKSSRADFPCPVSATIEPCTCYHGTSDNIYLYCPSHVTEEQLAEVFQQYFPVKELYRFRMEYNNELEALRNILNGVTFEVIELTPGPLALELILDYFLLDNKDTLRSIEISNSQLTSDFFPFIVLPQLEQLESLKISGSLLTFIPPLNAPKLTTLHLKSGLIEIIEEGTIPIQPGKTLLYLTNNPLHTLEPGSFFLAEKDGVFSSEDIIIDLSFNELQSLQTGTFPFRNGLLNIHLDDNQITSIEPGTFVLPDASGITYNQAFTIWLNNNKIQALQAGTFPMTAGDVDIFLFMNQISTIEPGAFFLPEGAVNSSSDVYITLQDNAIQSLQAGTFPLRNARMELYLYDNLISSIEPGAFVLPEIKDSLDIVLFLHGNQLTTIDELVFADLMPFITSFRIHTNPLACGCDIAWLVLNSTFLAKVDDAATCVDGTKVHDLSPAQYEDFC